MILDLTDNCTQQGVTHLRLEVCPVSPDTVKRTTTVPKHCGKLPSSCIWTIITSPVASIMHCVWQLAWDTDTPATRSADMAYHNMQSNRLEIWNALAIYLSESVLNSAMKTLRGQAACLTSAYSGVPGDSPHTTQIARCPAPEWLPPHPRDLIRQHTTCILDLEMPMQHCRQALALIQIHTSLGHPT